MSSSGLDRTPKMRSLLSLSSTTTLTGRYSSISVQSRNQTIRRLRIDLPFKSPSSSSACRCRTSLPASPYSSSLWFWSKRGVRGCGRWTGVYFPLLRMERSSTSVTADRNKGMVNQLQLYGIVNSSKVAEVMMAVDRGLFVPPGTPAYVDSPMQIGYNATISAPHMHATCLELLKEHLQPGMHALDVGSGTGYLTACFSMMVGPQGCAVGVEHIPELVVSSIQNIKRSVAAELLKGGALSMHAADGRLGWPDEAPYDAIHVGAAAPEVPQALLDQLKPGGRLVIPVGKIFQDLQVIDKKLDGSIDVRSETSVRYVPLTSRDAQLKDY